MRFGAYGDINSGYGSSGVENLAERFNILARRSNSKDNYIAVGG